MIDQEIIDVFLEEAFEILSDWERECLAWSDDYASADFDNIFRCAHNLKGSARSVGLAKVGDTIHKVEDIITYLKSGQAPLGQVIRDFLLESQALLVDWFTGLQSDLSYVPELRKFTLKADAITCFAEKTAAGGATAPKDFGTIAIEKEGVSVTDIEKVVSIQNRKMGQIMVDEGIMDEDAVKRVLDLQKVVRKKSGRPQANETIRVSVNKIEELIKLAGEVSLHLSSCARQNGEGKTSEQVSLAMKTSRAIQETALSLRMQPIDKLLLRLNRIADDAARSLGKVVSITTEGDEVELDKKIIEKMTDPLVHIIRNAVGHGVENPEERLDCGKSNIASVNISAVQDVSHVVVEISDDGRGMDPSIIYNKAIEKGLISPNMQLDQEQIFNLIFLPGFSTAEEVTDISGRGVGMDVVKRMIDDVGGKVSIESELNVGTKFKVFLPISVNVVDGLITEVGSSEMIVPLLDLREVIDLNDYALEKSTGDECMINVRGKVTPLLQLSDFFPTKKQSDTMGTTGLLVEVDSDYIAFTVDSLLGQRSVVVKPLSDKLAALPGYCGGTIMTDGSAGLIVSLKEIARDYIRSNELRS